MPGRTGPGTLTRGCLSRQRRGGRLPFPTLVIAAIALGIVGVVAKGLMYLLIIGIVVFLGALTLPALRMRRGPGKHPAR
jgi:Flp pilus assembly protein TadB